jgi:hypothetical protein
MAQADATIGSMPDRDDLVNLVQAANALAWSLEGHYRDRPEATPARIRAALDAVHASLDPFLPGVRASILEWTAMGSSS